MKHFIWIAALALALAACGSSKDESETASQPEPREMFVWNDPGAAAGNFDADYGDCKTQIEKDPALGEGAPGLAVVDAYIKCMQPKGWKFVNPNAPAQP